MNPYKILGVQQGADLDTCKKAYRSLSRKYHPDNLVTGDKEKFQEISKAWASIESGTVSDFEMPVHAFLKHVSLFNFKVA